tara:strand:- start:269 stop:499 length:231 start_codon:yes stop_codon:yes gene_type:complete
MLIEIKQRNIKETWKPVQYAHELFSLEYKRSMYESNMNIRKQCQRLAHLIWNCNTYPVKEGTKEKYIAELEMWCKI